MFWFFLYIYLIIQSNWAVISHIDSVECDQNVEMHETAIGWSGVKRCYHQWKQIYGRSPDIGCTTVLIVAEWL